MNATAALKRDSAGRLELSLNGEVFRNVTPVRAFPVTAPNEGIALMSKDGKELVWIARIADCEPQIASLVIEELAQRDFMPIISEITRVSSYVTPCTWTVATDRGVTQFILRGEEGIRKLAAGALLITDSYGLQYLVQDYRKFDRASRKILDRFL